MGLPLSAVVALLVFVPCVECLQCGGYTDCTSDASQIPYCCGFENSECCYTTNVVALWWFWFLLVVGLISIIACCAGCCCYQRRTRPTTGYVVQSQNPAPRIAVIQTNQTHTQAAQPAGFPPGYQNYGAVKVDNGPPPAYNGYQPTAPPQPPYQQPYHQPYQSHY